jgi:hypothetical protein
LRQKSHIPCSNATPHHHFQQQNRTVATQIPKFLYHRWHRQQIPTLTHNAIGKLFSEKPYQNQKKSPQEKHESDMLLWGYFFL